MLRPEDRDVSKTEGPRAGEPLVWDVTPDGPKPIPPPSVDETADFPAWIDETVDCPIMAVPPMAASMPIR